VSAPSTPAASDPSRSGARYVAFTTDLAVATDDRDRIATASSELCRLLGVDEALLMGRRVSDLVHPDDRVQVERAQLRPTDRRQMRIRLRRSDDGHVWTAATVTRPRKTAGQASQWAFVDITAQVQFEHRLVDLAGTWADVFDTLSEGVIVIDRDGITLAANAAAADFLGVEQSEVQGSLARAQVVVVDENGSPMPRERLPSTRAFRTGQSQEQDLAYLRRDGTTRWLHARVVPITRPPSKEVGRVAILLSDAVGAPNLHAGGAVLAAAQTALTQRELEVLQLLAQGMDVRAAAASLEISVNTVRGHLKQLMQKLDARSQLQAVVFAARAGLVRVE